VTDVGEISSVVKNGKNGFLVNVNQEQLFYDTLIQLMESDALRIDFGNAFYNTIVENYSEEMVLKKYLDWLQTI
jgi:glycosyltransferase involved in cell wall biosynthesis